MDGVNCCDEWRCQTDGIDVALQCQQPLHLPGHTVHWMLRKVGGLTAYFEWPRAEQ